MPSRKTVEAFAARVEAGDYVGAIEQFDAPDASTKENTSAPVIGRDVLVAKERGVMATFKRSKRRGSARASSRRDRRRTLEVHFYRRRRLPSACSGPDLARRTTAPEYFFYDPKQMAG